MDATATLAATPAGLHLRLSSRGFTFASYTMPADRVDPDSDIAERVLAEHGWTAPLGWTQERAGRYGQWTALIEPTSPDNQPKERP